MKKQDEELFKLIKSLTRHEKGYYVKYVNALPGKTGRRYMELFRVIESMKDYSEDELDKKLDGIGFPQHRYRIRHYLYHSVIECLQKYNKENSSIEKILSLLSQAYVLQKRRLHSQSNILADTAQQLAMRSGSYGLATEAVRVKHSNHLMLYQEEGSDVEKELQIQMYNYSTAQFQLLTVTRTSNSLLREYRKNGAAQTTSDVKRYQDLYEEFLSPNIHNKELNLWTKYYLLDCNSILGLCQNKPDKVKKYLEMAYHLIWENLEEFESIQPLAAVSYALLDTYMHYGYFDETAKRLEELENWGNKHKKNLPLNAYDHFMKNINLEWFNLLVMDHKWLDDKKLPSKVFSFFENKELTILQEYKYHFNCACYYIYNNQYKLALEQVNEILGNRRYKSYDISLYTETELLNLIIHLKMDNLELIESQLKIFRKRLRDGGSIPYQGLVKIIMEHFSDLIAGYGGMMVPNSWKKGLAEDLSKHYNKYPNQVFWLTFDFPWCFEEVF